MGNYDDLLSASLSLHLFDQSLQAPSRVLYTQTVASFRTKRPRSDIVVAIDPYRFRVYTGTCRYTAFLKDIDIAVITHKAHKRAFERKKLRITSGPNANVGRSPIEPIERIVNRVLNLTLRSGITADIDDWKFPTFFFFFFLLHGIRLLHELLIIR